MTAKSTPELPIYVLHAIYFSVWVLVLAVIYYGERGRLVTTTTLTTSRQSGGLGPLWGDCDVVDELEVIESFQLCHKTASLMSK